MKSKFLKLFFTALVLLSPTLNAATEKSLPHFDLEMTGAEYQPLLKKYKATHLRKTQTENNLEKVINLGQRNLDWLKHINQLRDPEHKISFSSKETQTGIPIDQPKIYNEELTLKSYNDLLAELPNEMRMVLVDGKPFTDQPPIAEEDYIRWGLKVDRIYQTASRWIMMQDYLTDLTSRRRQDIRGYFFFSKVENLKEKLDHWVQLDLETQDKFKLYLKTMCWNNQEHRCDSIIDNAILNNTVDALYEKYLPTSKQIYDRFFTTFWARDDVKWVNGNLEVPFLDPNNTDVKGFLATNIQDEWRWQDWKLLLNFKNEDYISRVVFEPGATPHVDGLSRSTITMDANAPLTEYDAQWTIRHEFGHILGFDDCYIEYYDDSLKAIISYQIDVTNIMCSRRGHVQEQHYLILKNAYESHV